MGSVRFAALQIRPAEVLDLTSLTGDALQRLVLPFKAAFAAHMADGRREGQPCTARRDPTDQNCPRPTSEARRLLILVYLKPAPRHVVQGRLGGMGPRKAQPWIHGLWVGRRAMRRAWGDAPTRSVTALAQRLGVAKAHGAALVVPPEGPPSPSALPMATPVPTARSPL
jgi:hypothetical protein